MDAEHDKTGTLRAQMKGHVPGVLASKTPAVWPADTASTLNARFGEKLGLENQHINQGAPLFVPVSGADFAVRRLTPVECERLQGFPDNWTRIPYRGKPAEQCPDGPRYKACGNSMAVPVMRWIGERIQMMEDIMTERDLFGEVDK